MIRENLSMTKRRATGTVDRCFAVLLAEDSDHDVRAIRRAWERCALPHPLHVVRDGQECVDYLLNRGEFADSEAHPRPGLLVLDLNMPRLNGFEVLSIIRRTPSLRRLPVVVMTTSSRESDLQKSYDLGANAFITKPVGQENLQETLELMSKYWRMVALPDRDEFG